MDLSIWSQSRDGFLTFVIIFLPLLILWNVLRRRHAPSYSAVDIQDTIAPLPMEFTPMDYAKALLCWIFLFMRLFVIKPGLYHIGERDDKAPLFVTGNYYLTVFLLARRIRNKKVRLLIVDTKGINVWCAAGKGQFSAQEIIKKAGQCGLLATEPRLRVVLPKLCLSGVNLTELRQNGIVPIIGPVYAKDVPAFLEEGRLRQRFDEIVDFGLRSRVFTALPTAVQFFFYFLGVYVVSLGYLSHSLIWIATGLAFLYPVLFPWLPGRLFSVKGLSLALFISILNFIFHDGGLAELALVTVFIFATSVFIGLSYTGNSAVSNYTSVRKETARFLPVVVILYLILIPMGCFF